MKLNLKLATSAICLALSTNAFGAATIADGDVILGVDDFGQLNIEGVTPDVEGRLVDGLRYVAADGTQYEATSHGCLCEGWGVAADGVFLGSANNDDGTPGLVASGTGFTSTATTATSVVTAGGDLQVTHDFALSVSDSLFRVDVTLENVSGADMTSVEYRRVMDWDAAPTAFSEFVTIGGTAAASAVTAANDDGFCDSNPTVTCGPRVAGATGDFEDSGPTDHGALFDFDFGALADGDSTTFQIYYGAALGETAARAALAAVGAEVFSFGWSSLDPDQDGAGPRGEVTPTFIFAFAGVGGEVIGGGGSSSVPVPATLFMFGAGLLGLALNRRGKKVS